MIDEIMFDNVEAVGEAQSETQPEEEVNAEKETSQKRRSNLREKK